MVPETEQPSLSIVIVQKDFYASESACFLYLKMNISLSGIIVLGERSQFVQKNCFSNNAIFTDSKHVNIGF